MLWTIEQLKELVTDRDDEPVRAWAARQLHRLFPNGDWTDFAIECLSDDNRTVANWAFASLAQMEPEQLAELDFEVSGPLSVRLAARTGDASAIDRVAESGYFDDVVHGAPAELARFVDDDEIEITHLARAREPSLAAPLIDMFFESVDHDDHDDVEWALDVILESAGFSLVPSFPDDLDDELRDALDDRDYSTIAETCLGRAAKLGGGVDERHVRWGLALGRAFENAGLAEQADTDDALIAFSIWRGLQRECDALAALDDTTSLADALELFRVAPSPFRTHLPQQRVVELWNTEFAEAPHDASAVVDEFLDAEFESVWDRTDALLLANKLDGFDLSARAARLFERMLDDPRFDRRAYEDVLFEHYARHPDELPPLLPDEPIDGEARPHARVFLLELLSFSNRAWATDRLFAQGARVSEFYGNDLAQTLRGLGDPDAVDQCLELYAESPHPQLLETVDLLARLGERDLPDELQGRIDVTTRSKATFEEELQKSDHIALLIRCEECGVEFCDTFDAVYVNPAAADPDQDFGDAMLPNRAVDCPACGATDRYTLPKSAQMRSMIMSPPDFIIPLQPWVLPTGTPLDKPTALLRSIRDRLATDPDDLDAWDDLAGLGHLFSRQDLFDEAVQMARALDPDYEPPEIVHRRTNVRPFAREEADRKLAEMRRNLPRRRRKEVGKARKVARFPIDEVFASDWSHPEELVTVVIKRRLPRGKYAVATALIDLGCLGMKDGFVATSVNEREVADLTGRVPNQLYEVDASFAAKIIDVAVRYAMALEFEPCPEYFAVDAFLGKTPRDHPDEVPLGHEGKPLYIASPYDDVDAIMDHLHELLGPDGYHHVNPV